MEFRPHHPLSALVKYLPRHKVWIMVKTWHYEGLILGYFGGHYRCVFVGGRCSPLVDFDR